MLEVQNVRFPQQSAQRSRYARACDALFISSQANGVFSAPLGGLPDAMKPDNSEYRYSIKPVHRPVPGNFAHSDIQTYRDGQDLGNSGGVPKSFKKFVRETLTEVSRIEIHPSSGGIGKWLWHRLLG